MNKGLKPKPETSHELHIFVTIDGDELTTLVMEPESGETTEFKSPISIDEHPEYDEALGNEIYSWIAFWEAEAEG